LKKIDLVAKPFEDEEISGASIVSCDKEHGSQDHDNINNLCLVGRCAWDVDHWFVHEDPIYEMDGESLVEENMNLQLPFPISLESKFMMLKENN
jgi:hypothetical protein